jgi:hypothetical protein
MDFAVLELTSHPGSVARKAQRSKKLARGHCAVLTLNDLATYLDTL